MTAMPSMSEELFQLQLAKTRVVSHSNNSFETFFSTFKKMKSTFFEFRNSKTNYSFFRKNCKSMNRDQIYL